MFWRRLFSIFLITLTCLPTAAGAVRSLGQEQPVIELSWDGVVEQTRPNYCGPAVIATLLVRLGVQITEAEVADSARLRPNGISLAEFSRLAERFGIPGRWFAVTRDTNLESLPLPAVVHLQGEAGHFAILERRLHGFIQLADPARGRILVSEKRFRREWTGRLFIFQHRSAFWSD